MDQDIKLAWVTALEGDDYKQGETFLVTNDNRMCCLGVLTDLHSKIPGSPMERAPEGECGFVDKTGRQFEGMPSKETYEWAGLTEGEAFFLASLNDLGTPFSAIAHYIRRYL